MKHDTGIPSDYYFCIAAYDDEPVVYFDPIGGGNKGQDHLVGLDVWIDNNCPGFLSDVMEAAYEIDFSRLPPNTDMEDGDVQAVYEWLSQQGFVYDDMGLDPNELIVPKFLRYQANATTVLPSGPGGTLSSDALKNHLVFILPTLDKMKEVFYAFEETTEQFKSLRNPKSWKRFGKEKGTVQDLLIGMPEDIGYVNAPHIVFQTKKFTPESIVVQRSFMWRDKILGGHMTIVYYTNESDTDIVAVEWNCD